MNVLWPGYLRERDGQQVGWSRCAPAAEGHLRAQRFALTCPQVLRRCSARGHLHPGTSGAPGRVQGQDAHPWPHRRRGPRSPYLGPLPSLSSAPPAASALATTRHPPHPGRKPVVPPRALLWSSRPRAQGTESSGPAQSGGDSILPTPLLTVIAKLLLISPKSHRSLMGEISFQSRPQSITSAGLSLPGLSRK